jgi:hypothetical protein
MSAPIITLTTDFGTRDPWVGIMKGVMLGICPEARLVDISHDIAPQDVLEGALCLEAAAGFFPAGTIHLAVVDPGVGSSRRPLALRAGGQCYVGPDNGLLSLVLHADGQHIEAVELTRQEYRLSATSQTFHGRDIFAPAAAHLASGVPLERLGPAVTDPVKLVVPVARHDNGRVLGEVIGADRFGNLLTSVTERDLAAFERPEALVVEIGGVRVGALVSAYSDARSGGRGAVVGSTGRLEVFVRDGNAQAALGLGRGAPVVVKRF